MAVQLAQPHGQLITQRVGIEEFQPPAAALRNLKDAERVRAAARMEFVEAAVDGRVGLVPAPGELADVEAQRAEAALVLGVGNN